MVIHENIIKMLKLRGCFNHVWIYILGNSRRLDLTPLATFKLPYKIARYKQRKIVLE